jgi:hypothetical protein
MVIEGVVGGGRVCVSGSQRLDMKDRGKERARGREDLRGGEEAGWWVGGLVGAVECGVVVEWWWVGACVGAWVVGWLVGGGGGWGRGGDVGLPLKASV